MCRPFAAECATNGREKPAHSAQNDDHWLRRLRGGGGGVGDDFDAEFAGARAIEFSEEDGLPASEDEASIFDPDGFGGADKRGFDVRVGVAFGMFVIAVVRDEAIKSRFDVARDGGIVAFIDEHARGGVRNIQVANAAGASGFADERFNLGGHAL